MKFFIIIIYLASFLKADIVTMDISPYFSKIKGGYYNAGVDNIIINDISNATSSINMAMYYLTNKHITMALIKAHQRGVDIKVYTDDRKISSKRYNSLISQGIKVNCDTNPKALMHNKFLIIDKKILWVSSANYTVYSFYRNYDNFLRVIDRRVISYYSKKFKLLYNHSPKKLKPYNSKNIEVYFSPDTNFENKIVSLINSSKSSIKFLAFAFTNLKISQALIDAKSRGVEVEGVFDESQNRFQKFSQYKRLKDNGLDVKFDKNRFKLHSKVFIIDENIVVMGSYNFTKKANIINDENSMVIKDRDIAKAYLKRFYEIFR
ncbi:Endonuclease [hydrothermal vent metagenome]|uniref:Endonuclease n=1 Tax=hydrothermal vent metagenome TaxID=652676 RepID=A0A1W1EK78_9ZZZZ